MNDDIFIFCGKCGKRMKENIDMPFCWDCYDKQEEKEEEKE